MFISETVCDFLYLILWNQGSTPTIHKKFSGTDQSGVEVNLKEPSIPIDVLKQAVQRVKAQLQVYVVQEGRKAFNGNKFLKLKSKHFFIKFPL